MDDIRKKIIVIACAVAGLLIAAVLVMKFYGQPKVDVTTSKEEQAVSQTVAVTGGAQEAAQGQTAALAVKAKPKSTMPSAEVYVKQFTEVFVERFFTYSNQNSNTHIDDAIAMSTAVMVKWVKTQAQQMSDEYQGVATQVVASSVRALTVDKATVGVDVQQIFEGQKSDTISRTGRAELVKIGKDWKIDGFYWE